MVLLNAAIFNNIIIALLLALAHAFDVAWLAWVAFPILILHIAKISFVTFDMVADEGLALRLDTAIPLGLLWIAISVFCYATYILLFTG